MLTYEDIEKAFEESREERVKRVRSRGMSNEDAEDVVQETFFRALKYCNTFQPHLQELKVWLDIIMNNAFKDYRHSNFTGDFSFREEQEEEDGEVMEDKMFSKDMVEVIREEIESLPPLDRQIVYAKVVLGHSYKACCEIFDINHDKVTNTLRSFRNKMKEKYGG